MDERSTVQGMRVQGADQLAGSSLDADGRRMLLQVLRIYCAGLDLAQLDDLRSSQALGRFPWLEAALSAAFSADMFDCDEWSTIVGHGRPTTVATMRAEQQLVWSCVFPDAPFPRSARRSRV